MDAAAARAIDPAGVAAVMSAFADASVPSAEADRIVTMESGWNPAARNPVGGAVGLLQWMPAVLEHAPGSPSPSAVVKMSRQEQARLIAWSFSKVRGYERSRAGDAYLWNFVPAYLHAPASKVVFAVGSVRWKENAVFREPGNGPITVRRILAIGRGDEFPGKGKTGGVASRSTFALTAAAAVGVGVGILLLRRGPS